MVARAASGLQQAKTWSKVIANLSTAQSRLENQPIVYETRVLPPFTFSDLTFNPASSLSVAT